MKTITIVIALAVSLAACEQKAPVTPSPKAPSGQITIMDYETCNGIQGKMIGHKSVYAFGESWNKNSKGQYVRTNCLSERYVERCLGYISSGFHIDEGQCINYVEVAPKSEIMNAIHAIEKQNQSKQNAKEEKIQNSGIL